MSRLSKLVAKPVEVDVEGDKYTIYPFTIQDLDLVSELSIPEKQNKALKGLVFKAIKSSEPDATDEEINRISLSYFNKFSQAVLKANGLMDDTGKTQ